MTKISIIMPVYNDCDVLDKSLNSVINQTFQDFELICVNDGSTDDSLDKLNDYASRHDFIKVYSQENQGSGKARNYAIDVATGEYIGFLDADDFFIDENSLKRLYDVARSNDATMVTGNILHDVDNPGDFVPFRHLEYFTEDKVILPEEYGIPWSFYKSIFKKDFILDNEIYFPDLLRGQDVVFLAEILSKVDKIYAVSCDVYAYVYYDAINRCNTFEKLHDQIFHYKLTFDYLNEPKFSKSRHDFEKAFIWFLNNLDNNELKTSLNIVNDIFDDGSIVLNHIKKYFSFKINNPNKPRISIISKVQKSKRNLNDVYQEILNQSFPDFELICVYDVLDEKSLNILNGIAEIDSRVKIFQSDRKNYGSAWNDALDMSQGEYVIFHNCNYEYSLFILDDLFLNAKMNDNSDIILFKIRDKIKNDFEGFLRYNFDEIFPNQDFSHFTFNYNNVKDYVLNSVPLPWFKLYKKEFLDKYEDFIFDLENPFNYMLFHVKSFLRADNISFVPIAYHFNERSKFIKKYEISDVIRNLNEIFNFLRVENYYDNFKDEFNSLVINQLYYNAEYFDSDIYFNISKEIILKLELSEDIPIEIYNKYYCIEDSFSLKEFKQKSAQFKNCTSLEEFELCQKKYHLILEKQKLVKENNDLANEIKKLQKSNQNIKD